MPRFSKNAKEFLSPGYIIAGLLCIAFGKVLSMTSTRKSQGSKEITKSSDSPGQLNISLDGLPRRSDWSLQPTPDWCQKLMTYPRPSGAEPGTPDNEIVCARRTSTGECFDKTDIRFFSQHHQGMFRNNFTGKAAFTSIMLRPWLSASLA